MPNKAVTYGEFIDAIEMDGLDKITGTLFRTKKRGKAVTQTVRGYWKSEPAEIIGAACAVGQACINLGITEPSNDLAAYVISLNDDTKLSLEMIAQKARNTFADKLNKKFTVPSFDYMPWVKKDLYKPKVKVDASAG